MKIDIAELWSRFAWGVVVAAAVVTSCGSPTASSSPQTRTPATSTASLEPVSVTVALVATVIPAPIFVGVEKGIYLKHGIDLKLNPMASAADTFKALQAGQAQVALATWAAMAPAVVQGVPIKFFFSLVGGPYVANYDGHQAIAVRPGIKATTVAELKGLKIGSSFGGGGDTWLRAHLVKEKLDPAKDVTLINVPFPNMLSALQSQAADAVAPPEPFTAEILSKVPGSRVLIRGGGLVDSRVGLAGDANWLARNPSLVEALMAAQAEANQYARQNLDSAAAATTHYLPGMDTSVIASALKYIDFDPRWSDKIQTAFEGTSRDLATRGTIKAVPKAGDGLALDRLTGCCERKYPEYYKDLK